MAHFCNIQWKNYPKLPKIGPFKLIKMLEMLEKAKIARKNAHFQSKTGGNFWPILAIFNLENNWTFAPPQKK